MDTGLYFRAGQRLAIGAVGIWSSDPSLNGPWKGDRWSGGPGGKESTLPAGGLAALNAPQFSLIGKTGDSDYFFVGPEFFGTAPAPGNLFLGMNDIRGRFGDNGGFLTVTITVYP